MKSNEKDWVAIAQEIATRAHEGQTRREGTPYIEHPARVAAKVEDRLKPIAWLHDLVEDTTVTLEDLKGYGFPEYVITAIDVLTHKDHEPNDIYWRRIAKYPDAVKVKIEDIGDNLGGSPTERQKQKYTKALTLFRQLGY